MDKIKKVKQYFELHAYGWENRKSLDYICHAIQIGKREIRDIIWTLRTEHGMMIAADLKHGGYFIVNRENLFDVAIAKHYISSQWSRYHRIREGLKPFDQIFPEGQIEMDIAK